MQVARWVLLEPLTAWDVVTLPEYTLSLEEAGLLAVKSNSVRTGVLGELVGVVLSDQLLPGSGWWDPHQPECRDLGNGPITACGWLFCTLVRPPSAPDLREPACGCSLCLPCAWSSDLHQLMSLEAAKQTWYLVTVIR